MTASRRPATSLDAPGVLSAAQDRLKQANDAVKKDDAAVTTAKKKVQDDDDKKADDSTKKADSDKLNEALSAQKIDQAAYASASKALSTVADLISQERAVSDAKEQLRIDEVSVKSATDKLTTDKAANKPTTVDEANLSAATSKRDQDSNAQRALATRYDSAVSKAKADLTSASATLAKAATAVSSSQAALDKDTVAKAASDVIATDGAKLATAKLEQGLDAVELDTAQAIYKASLIGQPRWTEAFSLAMLPVGPDPKARYVADVNHNATRDDNQKLSVVGGLLTSSTITSTDQTPNLLITLVDTAITFGSLKASSTANYAPQFGAPRPEEPCNPYDISVVFDPLDQYEFGEAVSRLSEKEANIHLSVVAGDELSPTKIARTGSPALQADGLVYRVATPVVVSITPMEEALSKDAHCPLATLPTALQLVGIVPDSRSQFVISSRAGPFTTTSYTFGFQSGMLTDYGAQRPSEIAAVANIPIRIAQDIISIPAQIFQLKINYDTQATALVNAQTALQQAQLARPTAITNSQTTLVNAQTALRQAQLAQPTAITNSETAYVNAQTALLQAQLGQPAAVVTAQTALVNAETTLQQAQINQPTAVTNAQSALINAQTAFQQAQANQGTQSISAQTALIQAHVALLQAEASLQAAMNAQNKSGGQ